MQMKKNLKNKIKKFLTKQKASDIINELSQESEKHKRLLDLLTVPYVLCHPLGLP